MHLGAPELRAEPSSRSPDSPFPNKKECYPVARKLGSFVCALYVRHSSGFLLAV